MHRNKKLRLFILPGILCMLAMLVAACGSNGTSDTSASSTSQKASVDKQVFNLAFPGIEDIKTFDPAMATSQTSLDAINMSFTGLVQLDNNLQVQPQMASSWKQSADGLTWTFALKPGLKFSDGTPITSKDIAYSIDRALQPALNSPASPSYLNLIKDSDKLLTGKIKTIIGDSLMTPDDNTIVIVANTNASYFLATLTYQTSYVVEKSLVDKYGDIKWTDHLTEGGTAGPFKVQEYTHGQRIVFVPDPNYYGPKPQLQKVTYTFVKDAETAYKNYQVGSIDAVGVPFSHLEEAKALTKEYHQVPILTTAYYGMNMLAKPFDNIKIRQAFALAINKDAINKAVYKGVYIPTNHIVPQGMPGYNPDLKGPDGMTSTSGNPTMAKQLLQEGMQEAGYANVAALPTISFKYPSGSADTDNEVAAVIQQWQSVLDVNVKAVPEDFEKLSAEQPQTVGNDKLQFFYAAWGDDYPDPQDFLTLQFSKDSPNNQTNYGQNQTAAAATQVQMQNLMTQADTMTDSTARMKAYNQAEQHLVNDVAWLPTFQWARARLLQSYVVGRVYNAQDFIPADAWSKMYIAAH
ncbi:MAG TPA: peptide ABC transporter substrate-binding protein [Ktedonosporobacter sp.]|nr:peptide ABC transporter substrate-binding protein [Ktedonosporobacter sp.]